MLTLRWLRLAALCALSFSAASAVDEVLDLPAFCGAGGGCAAVRESALGHELGHYLPFLGLFAYSTVFWGSLVPMVAVRRLVLWCAVLGGLVAIGLLGLQWFVAKAFCELCLGADGAGLVVAGFAVVALRKLPDRTTSWPFAAWAALFLMAVGSPPVLALSKPVPLPQYVQDVMKPDSIDVVEISDFECPYCRALHGVIAELLQEYEGRVRFVRLPYPLTGHRHAIGATRAYFCADGLGQGEAMAHLLFTSKDLSWHKLPDLAPQASLPREPFEACLASGASLARVQAARKVMADEGVAGVPVVWVEGRHVPGFDSEAGSARYREVIEEALSGQPVRPRPLPFVILGVIVAVVVSIGVRASSQRRR